MVALVLGFFLAAAGSAEAGRRPLLTEIRDQRAAEILLRRAETRARRVTVDLTAIAAADAPEGADSIDVDFFPDVGFTATKTGFERRNARNFTWFGKVPADPLSMVILVAGEGQVRGSVFAHGKHYVIRGADAVSQVAVELDQSAFPPETCDRMQDGGGAFLGGTLSLPAAQSDTGAVIDVLVVYTPAARSAEGGTTPMNNLIALAVAETNTSYGNSGIAPRLNLVHAEEIAYTETGDWDLDLDRLRGTSDGFMDGVHALRDAYTADVVVLLINNVKSCGQAYLTADATTAFALVDYTCATGNYSFGHEIGHLHGARHDMYVDPTLGSIILGVPVDYNHGHVSTAKKQRTVMAYDDKCLNAGLTCIRVPYWSNPGVNYPSTTVPTGTATRENNALVLNNTAASVANFRQARKTLTVRSTYPAAGVAITVAPPDTGGLAGGTTGFTRSYALDAIVSLTAPAVNGDGNNFAGWIGCAGTSGGLGEICSVTMSADKTVVANFTRLAPTSFTLWSSSSTGQAAVLEIDPATNALQNYFWLYSPQGVGAPWKATSYTRIDATTAYVLWTRSDTGRTSFWKINPAAAAGYPPVVPVGSAAELYSTAGVGAPWQATSFKYVGPAEGYVLWTRSDAGKAALWRINPGALAAPGVNPPIPIDSSALLYSTAGVGTPWQATSFEYASPTEGYVLWTRSDVGKAALWRINPGALATPGAQPPIPVESSAILYSTTGVGAPWQATGFEYVSTTEGYVLWTRSDIGRAAFWRISPGNMGGTLPIPVDSSSAFSFPAELGSSFEALSYAR